MYFNLCDKCVHLGFILLPYNCFVYTYKHISFVCFYVSFCVILSGVYILPKKIKFYHVVGYTISSYSPLLSHVV
jgi:hypothetical protein